MRALISRDGATQPILAQLPDPTPGPGEVLIRATAATVNPIDALTASGASRPAFGLAGDAGLGWEMAGEIVELGAGVEGFSVGQAVATLFDNPAAPARGHSELGVVPAKALAAIPGGMNHADAASVALNALTAAMMLDLLGPSQGRTLLVTGAAGAVGGYLLELAPEAGWQVTGLARETDREFVTARGAELITELPEAHFDAVADGATMQEQAIKAARDGGVFVGVLPPLPVPSERGIQVSAVLAQADGARIQHLLERTHRGELTARVTQTVPFEDFQSAYDAVATPHGRRGRVVLTF